MGARPIPRPPCQAFAAAATFAFAFAFGGALRADPLATDRPSAKGAAQQSESSSGSDRAPLAAVLAGAASVGDEVAFADVVAAATGHRVVPVDPAGPAGAAVITAVSEAAAATARAMNDPGAPLRGLRRINEASRHFEDALARQLDAHPDFACAAAPDAAGQTQRPGYPDLKLVHLPTGSVTYLDPKLFDSATRESSLRTFYYEPPAGTARTNKITTDAHHLVVGFEHDGRDGAWTFTAWHLVDLSRLAVRLKAEFQADNRSLYQDGQVLSSGTP